MTTNISLSSFPATLAFTANGASGATQEYVIKLSLSPGTYQLSVLPDLMVVTTAQGAVTADDVNVFIPEAVIGTPYVTRAIDYWDSNGQLHSYDSSIFDLATTDDTIATAIVASEGYLPNYGGFTYYTANITIAPQQTITYTDGSR
ncbi:MAG: hypothetical protein VB032_01630 [Burkholderiaceae bacterium]|nr:hypothetical protein [Burkholderiaceae bacterium]